MSEEQNPIEAAPEPRSNVRRRAVIKSAAWSLPAIAAATSMPLAAASGGVDCVPDSFVAPSAGTYTVIIPACASSVTFEILGGDGGRIGGIAGGRGAHITGTIAMTPGLSDRSVTLITGGEGQGGGSTWPRKGGVGYGNGGDTWGATGAGGGGSAILIDGVPYVVAGGGGGGGNAEVTVQANGDSVRTYFAPDHGVDAGYGSADGSSTGYGMGFDNEHHSPQFLFMAGGGIGATGATGGAAAGPAAFGPAAAGNQYPGTAGGNNGTGNNGGGNGGNGSTTVLTNGITGGGGGGGWAGGGGGLLVQKTAGGHPSGFANAGSAGGAGSSYTGGTGVVVTSQGPRGNARGDGSIVISWS